MNPTTGKPVLSKLHVHTGDKVIVIAGADKGVISEVTYVRARGLCCTRSALSLVQGFGRRATRGRLLDRRAPAAPGAFCAWEPTLAGRALPCRPYALADVTLRR